MLDFPLKIYQTTIYSMHFPARPLLTSLLLLCLLFCAVIFSPQAYAQVASTNSYNVPNTDENVPHNQHTYTQSLMIEVLSAVICQLSGIDPVDPGTPCLGINTQTNKLGYASSPVDQNGK